MRENGDVAGARAAAARSAELAPEQPEVHMAVGHAAAAGRHRRRHRREASAAFRRALALEPDHSAAHHALAAMHARGASLVAPGRFASAAGGFATAVRANPRSEASRRALDVILDLFLRRLAYFIGLDAVIANLTHHSQASAARLVPALLAIPLLYACRFVLGLPGDLRPYLLHRSLQGGRAIATALELGAIGAVVASGMVGEQTRGTLTGLALAAALLARLILFELRRR